MSQSPPPLHPPRNTFWQRGHPPRAPDSWHAPGGTRRSGPAAGRPPPPLAAAAPAETGAP